MVYPGSNGLGGITIVAENTTREYMQEPAVDEIELKEIFALLYGHKWFIVIITGLFLVFAVVFALNVATKYKVTALVQVSNKVDGAGLGGALQSLTDMSGLLSQGGAGAQTSDVETALLHSRFILQPTIDNNRLNIVVKPNYFPVFGFYLARHYQKSQLASPLWGVSSFAWGGEQVTVDRFVVPAAMISKKFHIVKTAVNQYNLYASKGELVLTGKVNKLAHVSTGQFSGLEVLITKLQANIGTIFSVTRLPNEGILEQLSKKLLVTDLGSQGNTGVLSLSLQGKDKEKLPQVLNTIIDIEVQNNIQKKSKEAKNTLVFLNKQLPRVKKDLNQAEVALEQYLSKTGSLGLSEEGKILLSQVVTVEQEQEQLKLQKASLLQKFTAQHPYVIAVVNKQKSVQQELNNLATKLRQLPKVEQEAIGLEREVKVKNELYLSLLNKIQQLQVIKAGTVSDVEILDRSTVPLPLPSYKLFILLGGVFFGFIFAAMIVFVRKMLDNSMRDPDYIEEKTGIPSYAIVPHSKRQEQIIKAMKRGLAWRNKSFILAEKYPKDAAIEGIRSLRTSMQFALMEAENNIVSIMGTSPNIGKSFVSLNLGYLLADSGKKVLLIDADLRKGKLHKYLSLLQAPGLAEILHEDLAFEKGKHVIRKDGFDFIACGNYPKNPSELLLSADFTKLLDKLSNQYDIVIIDTPPVLAVTDSVIIAKQTGVNLFIVGFGKESFTELNHAVKRVKKNSINIDGLVLNNISRASQSYGSYNYYYQYDS